MRRICLFVTWMLLAVLMIGCSSDSAEEQKAHASCKDKACGDSCTICAPGDTGCYETAVEKYCQPDGSCSAGKPTCDDDAYHPCEGKACGDSCTTCAPNDSDCTETGEVKYCQLDGSCSSQQPSCSGAYDPCQGKDCGDSCRICAPDDSACEETAVEKFCQTDGSCSAGEPNCDATCGERMPIEAFEQCTGAEDGRACIEMGGDWSRPPSSEQFSCVCPTGEDNCACTSSDDCLGACIAPMTGDFQSCKELAEGTCTTRWPVGGCRCWFDADGVVTGACVD